MLPFKPKLSVWCPPYTKSIREEDASRGRKENRSTLNSNKHLSASPPPVGINGDSLDSDSSSCRKNSNNRTVCYVVGVPSNGNVGIFLIFLWRSGGLSSSLFAVFFAPFLKWVIRSTIWVFTIDNRNHTHAIMCNPSWSPGLGFVFQWWQSKNWNIIKKYWQDLNLGSEAK